MRIMTDSTDLVIVSKKLADHAGLLKGMHPGIIKVAEHLETVVRAEAPYRTGRLARGTTARVLPDLSVVLETSPDVLYAKYVYGGTKAHVVQGNPLLVFSMGGGPVFARHVHIPAISANPYLERSWARHEEEFDDAVAGAAEESIQKELRV